MQQNLNTPRVDSGGLLTEADFDKRLDRHFLPTRRSAPDLQPVLLTPPPVRRCNADACNQGRKACPAPEACRKPEPELEPVRLPHGSGLFIGVLGSLVLWIALLSFAYLVTRR